MSHRYFIASCAQLTSFFLLSFSFFNTFVFFLHHTDDNYRTPIKSKNKKGPRSSYVGGDNGNALGEKVVVYLPDGSIFCLLWVNSRLDSSILQFLVSDDGRKII